MKVYKKIVSIIIAVFLINVNIFASVVSDNDGSAFITKAEFDSLKNNFQSQIDSYNTSIDSKIDSAIASYLAGIKVETSTDIKPLVSNYTDIKWKNDLYMKLTTREFSNYNTYTDTSYGWQIPVFTNYRMLRAGRYHFSGIQYSDIEQHTFSFEFNASKLWFLPTDRWFPSGEGVSSARTTTCGPLVIHSKPNEKAPQINTGTNVLYYETQMRDSAYPAIVNYSGGTIGNQFYNYFRGNQRVSTGDGAYEVTKESDDIIAFKLKWHNMNSWGADIGSTQYVSDIFRIKKQNAGYGSADITDVRTNLPGSVWGSGALGEFNPHLVCNAFPDSSQLDIDRNTLKFMFLGNTTNTKVNCAVRNATSRFSDWAEYDFSNSEMGSFVANTNSSVRANRNGQNWGDQFQFCDDTGTIIEPILSLPLWPQYYLKDLINPDFKFDGSGLQIGGGIPIANKILKKGILKVTLKYTVADDDVTSSTTPSQDIYLSFKKADFLDTADSYYTDNDGNLLKDKLWEPTTTDTTYNVDIPVEVGDNVWFRIGPKDRTATGLYAKINDMTVKLVLDDNK